MLIRKERNNAENDFCQSMENTIRIAESITEKSTLYFIFKDGLDNIRLHLTNVKTFYTDHFKPAIQAEQKERSRNHFHVPAGFYHAILNRQSELKEQQSQLRIMRETFELKKEDLKNKKWQISESASENYGAQTLKIAHAIEVRNQEFDEATLEYNKLRQQINAKHIEINSHCCSFFKSCVQKENAELEKLELELLVVEDKLRKLSKKESRDIETVVDLKGELKKIDDELYKQSQEYAARVREVEDNIESIKKNIYRLKFAEQKEEIEFNNRVSFGAAIFYVRMLDAWFLYQNAIEKLPIASKVKSLQEQSIQTESQINDLMIMLRCVDLASRNIMDIYNRFKTLNIEEQKQFLEGNAKSVTLHKIIDFTPASLPLPTLFSPESKLKTTTLETKREINMAAPSIIFNI